MHYEFYDLGPLVLGLGILIVEWFSPLSKNATKQQRKNKKLMKALGFVGLFGGLLYNLLKYKII